MILVFRTEIETGLSKVPLFVLQYIFHPSNLTNLPHKKKWGWNLLEDSSLSLTLSSAHFPFHLDLPSLSNLFSLDLSSPLFFLLSPPTSKCIESSRRPPPAPAGRRRLQQQCAVLAEACCCRQMHEEPTKSTRTTRETTSKQQRFF